MPEDQPVQPEEQPTASDGPPTGDKPAEVEAEAAADPVEVDAEPASVDAVLPAAQDDAADVPADGAGDAAERPEAGESGEAVAEEDDDELPLPDADVLAEGGELEPAPVAVEADSDTDDIADAGGELGEAEDNADSTPGVVDWDTAKTTASIVSELKRVEQRVRELLEERDPKRKRKLAGTRRWFELHEDILALRHTGRFDESVLDELQRLILRRHHLFRRLHFLSRTRPVWNS